MGRPHLTEHSSATVDERVIIVDRHNRQVDVAPRSEMRAKGLRYRATAIFVVDRAGRVFVQRRTETKDIAPGMLDLCAGGVVVDGESYQECAVREAEEELGITDTPLEAVFDSYYCDAGGGANPPNRVWNRVFICRNDGPFSLQPEEIVSGAFVAIPEILADDLSRYTPDTVKALRELLGRGALAAGL